MADLVSAVNQDLKAMLDAVKEAEKRGQEYAKAEAEYQKAKNIRVLELRNAGFPATLIQLLIKGDEAVNELLFDREVAQVMYEVAREEINAHKLSARLLEQQIQREWNQAGGLV